MSIADHFGNKLIYRAATGLEKAMADVESDILLGTVSQPSELSAELVIETWDPWLTQIRNLPFLAWAFDVDIWEDGWSEATQREWVDRQWEFKRKRGSIEGIRMALDFAGRGFLHGTGGYRVTQYVVPPQAFFASPDLTVDEFNSWIKLMPEVRIYLGQDIGNAFGDELYLTDDPEDPPIDGFLDVHCIGFDDGPELYGRRAIIRQAGHPDKRLKVIEHNVVTAFGTAPTFENIFEPGLCMLGFCIGEDAFETSFLDFEELAPKTYAVSYDRDYEQRRTEVHLSAVAPTQEPISVTYERDSDIGDAGPFMFLDDWELEGEQYIEQDFGANMLADMIWLFDEAIAVPMTKGLSFLDVDRLGAHYYQMELMIDLRQFEEPPSIFVDEGFVEDTFLNDEDNSHIDRACRAIVAAKSLRDRALIAFDPLRQLEAGDRMTPATLVSDWVHNEL